VCVTQPGTFCNCVSHPITGCVCVTVPATGCLCATHPGSACICASSPGTGVECPIGTLQCGVSFDPGGPVENPEQLRQLKAQLQQHLDAIDKRIQEVEKKKP
jgi:hypothetical protein